MPPKKSLSASQILGILNQIAGETRLLGEKANKSERAITQDQKEAMLEWLRDPDNDGNKKNMIERLEQGNGVVGIPQYRPPLIEAAAQPDAEGPAAEQPAAAKRRAAAEAEQQAEAEQRAAAAEKHRAAAAKKQRAAAAAAAAARQREEPEEQAAEEQQQAGRGRGGKGLGKGGAKRFRRIMRDNIQGITKPAIRRLARRGGVKRISGTLYEESRNVLKVFLQHVIHDALEYMDHARRKTVTGMDVVYALKRQGRTLYGFGG
jgi:histone H4